MEKFAKLFELDGLGQVLIVADKDDDGLPAVKVSIKPPGLGVCTSTHGFDDTDEGWQARGEAFDATDEAKARAIATQVFELVAPFTSDNEPCS